MDMGLGRSAGRMGAPFVARAATARSYLRRYRQ